jgi:hypothetical protein
MWTTTFKKISMPSKKKAIKDPDNTPAKKAAKYCEILSITLYRLEVIDIKTRVDLYFDLRDYWLTIMALENRKEWERLRGR